MLIVVGYALTSVGCAATPYRQGRFRDAVASDEPIPEVVFVYGKPHKFLDGAAWVVGLPSRILPFHPKVNNHTISPETEEKLQAYLQDNDLTDVLVRVNQYDPAGEWRRLRENTRMAPGWKYSFGAGTLAAYTLLPGRVLGGDMYNPFTNSLYVNSDVAALLITEAAYAKDVHSQSMPGAYAAFNEVPVLTLWRYSKAVNETVAYALHENDWELERETYRTVYPIMGVQAALGGRTAASWATVMPTITVPIIMVGGAVAGHTVGQTTIAQRERERNAAEVELPANTREDENDSGIRLIGFEELSNSEGGPFHRAILE